MWHAVIAALVVLVVRGFAGAQPANDDCAGATVIGSLPFTDTIDTSAATTEAADPVIECDGDDLGQSAQSAWYRFTSVNGGSLEVDTFGSDYDTLVAAWRGTCGGFALAQCNRTDYDQNYFGTEARVIVTLAAGETIYLEVTTEDPPGGNAVLNVKETSIFQATDDAVFQAELPDVAAAADGTFLLTWTQLNGSTRNVMARRYCDTGVPAGEPFLVTDAAERGYHARIARAGDKGFVVAWLDNGIRGRRLTPAGVPLGGDFEVSPDDAYRYYLGVDADAAGNFIVSWSGYGDGDEYGIAARRFDDSGIPLGSVLQVNTFTAYEQRHPAIAVEPDGDFVVTWQSGASSSPSPTQDGDDWGAFGRRFAASGAPAGAEFQISPRTENAQYYPTVATEADGEFVVAWWDRAVDCGSFSYCVMGRRYDAAGVAGPEFTVSSPETGPGGYPPYLDIAAAPDGRFVVAWAKDYDSPFARAFDATGTPVGDTVRLSHVEDAYQHNTKVAMADDGDFVVVWDWSPWGSHYEIMGRSEPENPSCPAATGCPAQPRSGCKLPTLLHKGRLSLRDQPNSKSDALVWKWVKGEATSMSEIGNPLGSDTYTVCLYDAADMLLAEAIVPPGGMCDANPCWKDLNGVGFRYVDKAASNGGIAKLLLKSGDAGKAKMVVKGKGLDLTMPILPPSLPMRAQIASSTGTCWEAEYRSGGVVSSSSTSWAGMAHAD